MSTVELLAHVDSFCNDYSLPEPIVAVGASCLTLRWWNKDEPISYELNADADGIVAATTQDLASIKDRLIDGFKMKRMSANEIMLKRNFG